MSRAVAAGTASRVRDLIAAVAEAAGGRNASRPVIGVVRGFGRRQRRAGWVLRTLLAEAGLEVAEITPAEAARGRRGGRGAVSPGAVGLLVAVGDDPGAWALRWAAQERVPLLTCGDLGGAVGGTVSVARRDVLAVDFGDERVAVEGLVLRPDQADSTLAVLMADAAPALSCGGGMVRITLDAGRLDARLTVGEEERRLYADRIRHETTWGNTTVEIDGVPVGVVRGGIGVRVDPGRLRVVSVG